MLVKSLALNVSSGQRAAWPGLIYACNDRKSLDFKLSVIVVREVSEILYWANSGTKGGFI
jgi:hypothetical protein